jgi:hypothetical protein
MSALAIQIVDADGLAIVFTNAAGGGDTAPCGSQNTLLVKNGDSASHDVILATPGTVDGLAIADRTIPVAAGAIEAIPLDHALYADADGIAHLTYSATTSMSVAAIQR